MWLWLRVLVHIRLVLGKRYLLPNLLVRQGCVDKPSRPCMLARLLMLLCLLRKWALLHLVLRRYNRLAVTYKFNILASLLNHLMLL